MHRYCKCVCALILTASLSGCGTEAEELLSRAIVRPFSPAVNAITDLACGAASVSGVIPVAQSVPPILSVVRDDPARFLIEDHPLADVPSDMVIDDLSGLDGCWGRYALGVVENDDTGEVFEVEEAEVIIFDLAGGHVTRHFFGTRTPEEFVNTIRKFGYGQGLFGETPIFFTTTSSLTITGDSTITTEGLIVEGAAIEADGRLVFDCQLALSIALNTAPILRPTLQGDFLRMRGVTFPQGAATQKDDRDEFGELWVRFDCAEQ